MRTTVPSVSQPQQDLAVNVLGQSSRNHFLANQSLQADAQSDRLVIKQIDTFVPDATGFNHGLEVGRALAAGGGDPSLAGKIDLQQYNVAGNIEQGTLNALRDIEQQVRSGKRVDAVNISLQDNANNATTQQIRQSIERLSTLGVPVVVAAGNNGPGQVNTLASNSAFVVRSATNGRVNASSGQGNIVAEGRTTSFAAANLTPLLASRNAMARQANRSPGVLPPGGGSPGGITAGLPPVGLEGPTFQQTLPIAGPIPYMPLNPQQFGYDPRALPTPALLGFPQASPTLGNALPVALGARDQAFTGGAANNAGTTRLMLQRILGALQQLAARR
jgi:hypothetical protein